MKILLLNGSPKGEASDTLMLSKAFLDGMGRKYEQIDLIKIYCALHGLLFLLEEDAGEMHQA